MSKFKFPPELGGGIHEPTCVMTINPDSKVLYFEVQGEIIGVPTSILTRVPEPTQEPTEPGFYLIRPGEIVVRRSSIINDSKQWLLLGPTIPVTWGRIEALYQPNSIERLVPESSNKVTNNLWAKDQWRSRWFERLIETLSQSVASERARLQGIRTLVTEWRQHEDGRNDV